MQEIRIQANGLSFSAQEAGQGPLVLLLHGFPELSRSWRRQLPVLAEAGLHAVAPDMRGYGGTDRPRRVSDYDLDLLADDVAGLIEALGADRAHIVAHDWGGGVAWHFAVRHPELLDRLAVLNCPHPRVFQRALVSSPRQLLRSWYMFFFQVPWLPEWLIRLNARHFAEAAFRGTAARPGVFSDEDIRAYARALAEPGAARAGIAYYRAAFRAFFGARKRGALWARPIDAPTMLIWGTQDTALGEELVEPHVEFASGPFEIVRIESSGHWVQQEAPDEVNKALLRFLV